MLVHSNDLEGDDCVPMGLSPNGIHMNSFDRVIPMENTEGPSLHTPPSYQGSLFGADRLNISLYRHIKSMNNMKQTLFWDI